MDMNILGGVGSHLIIRVNTVSLKNHLSGDHFTPGYLVYMGDEQLPTYTGIRDYIEPL